MVWFDFVREARITVSNLNWNYVSRICWTPRQCKFLESNFSGVLTLCRIFTAWAGLPDLWSILMIRIHARSFWVATHTVNNGVQFEISLPSLTCVVTLFLMLFKMLVILYESHYPYCGRRFNEEYETSDASVKSFVLQFIRLSSALFEDASLCVLGLIREWEVAYNKLKRMRAKGFVGEALMCLAFCLEIMFLQYADVSVWKFYSQVFTFYMRRVR